MSLDINRGEAERMDKDSQWYDTIDDLADLIHNSRSNMSREHDRQCATRAISFVLNNMEGRGQIDSEFINEKVSKS